VNTTVVAVTKTNLDWQLLEALSQKIQGRSVLASLDRRNITARHLPALVASLAEFQIGGTDYMSVLLSSGSHLKHISIGFLVQSDKEAFFEIAIDGRLAMLDCDNDNVMLVSATLYDWRESIIVYCSRSSTARQREFCQAILREFDRLGLSRLWANYNRVRDYLVEQR
jgi:hypothetical protein